MNLETKVLSATGAKPFLLGWGMVLIYVAFNSLGAFILKTQVQKLGTWSFSNGFSVYSFFMTLFSSWQTWMGLISISTATAAWIIALSHLELSKAYPVAIGLNLLIVISASLVFFHEPLTVYTWIGTILIFSGVMFLFS
ncbi:MAG: hypothetical protein WCF19_03575 [Chlamydiales bacterium]